MKRFSRDIEAATGMSVGAGHLQVDAKYLQFQCALSTDDVECLHELITDKYPGVRISVNQRNAGNE